MGLLTTLKDIFLGTPIDWSAYYRENEPARAEILEALNSNLKAQEQLLETLRKALRQVIKDDSNYGYNQTGKYMKKVEYQEAKVMATKQEIIKIKNY